MPRVQEVCPLRHGSHLQSRRRFLKVATLGTAVSLIESSVPFGNTACQAKETQASQANRTKYRFTTTDGKDPEISMILIYMQGGPSQWEMFNVGKNLRENSVFKTDPIPTSTDITVSPLLRRLKDQMHKFLIVQNLFHGEDGHDQAAATVFTSNPHTVNEKIDSPGVESPPFLDFARFLTYQGSEDIGYVVLHNSDPYFIVNTSGEPAKANGWDGPFRSSGCNDNETIYIPYRAGAYNFINPFPKSFSVDTLTQELLDRMESYGHRFAGPSKERYEQARKKAERMINGDFNEAFDIYKEPKKIQYNYEGGDLGIEGFSQQLLLARRLVERGARVVVVNDGDYDHHDLIEKNSKEIFPRFAKAVSALLEDLERIDKKVVVAIFGEFGRHPEVNEYGGREHWPHAFSALFTGHGIKAPKVIGEIGKDYHIKGDANKASDLPETLMRLLGIARYKEVAKNGILVPEDLSYIQL